MRERRFRQVDVFTDSPYRGNPVAVVIDSEGLSEAEMLAFARWTNLSETTFLRAPTDARADYGLRIFTPGGELPFAGHPTLGSCHAWLAAGGKAKDAEGGVIQECKVGLVPVRQQGARLAFAAPPLTRRDPGPGLLASVLAALGLEASMVKAAQLLNNGPEWLGILLADPEILARLAPDHARLAQLGHKVGVAARRMEAMRSDDEPLLEVRAFAAPIGIHEDPVTGSLNASLAEWLIERGELPTRYVAAQGSALQRAGRVFVERTERGTLWVGGGCVTCIEGNVRL